MLKRYCLHCARWQEPALHLDGVVVGHGRLGVRILALVAWLHTVLRLPLRPIQTYLAALHQLRLSVGQLSAILGTVAAEAVPAVAAIKAALQASPVVHLDETSWREQGQNGYVWVMTNAGAGADAMAHVDEQERPDRSGVPKPMNQERSGDQYLDELVRHCVSCLSSASHYDRLYSASLFNPEPPVREPA